jgi:mannose-6-phosphate isomerase-like protein (cupin superfamily)
MEIERLVADQLAGLVLDPGGTPQFVIAEWSDDGPSGVPIAPPHIHLEEDEAWYVLEGRLGVRLGDREVEADTGGAVYGPRGTSHTYWNAGTGRLRYLLIMGPRTRAALAAMHDGTTRDRAALTAVFADHGIELL